MTKRKRRNAVTLVSLLLALAALIGFYFWYSNRPTKSEESTGDTNTISLAKIASDNISSIHYVAKDADITLTLNDKVWKSEEEPDRPINQTDITGIVSLVSEVKANKVVKENPEDMSEYGLATPAALLEVNQKDGTVLTLKIGDSAPTGDGYYALVNDDKKVYLMDSSYGTGLEYSDSDLTGLPESPSITAENIKYLNIMNRDGNDLELLYDENNNDKSGSDMYTWVLLKPFGEGYTADSTKTSEMLANYTTFTFNSCVDYKGADLSLYGLDDPKASINLKYVEASTDTTDSTSSTSKTTPKEFKIYIGNQNEDGDYYVKIDDSNSVYAMSADTIDKMLKVDAFTILNKFVTLPNIDTVDRVDINIQGKPYTMEIKRTTEKKDGKEETKATYYYNGKEISEDNFKTLYQAVISATYDAEIKEDNVTVGDDPYMAISFHIFGDQEKTLSASYRPYDDSFDTVDSGDGIRFFADKRKIADIAKAVIEFKAEDK